MTPLGRPTTAKRRKAQRWPFIKKRTYPSGAVAWMVDARTKTGGERKSFETLAEAETFASQCRIRRTNEGNGAFGNEELARFGKTVQDAVTFYLAHLRQQERSVPLSQAINEVIEIRKGGGASKRYLESLTQRLRRFEAGFPGRVTADISTKELDEWLAELRVAALTRNHFRQDVRTLFSFCVKRGYVAFNPAAATEKAKVVEAAPGILSVEEAETILRVSAPEILAYVAIGLFAGLRRSELEKLDWSEVKLGTGVIEVRAEKAKTSRRRLVRIQPSLTSWLEPLFPKAGPVAPPALRERLEEVQRAAGFGAPGSATEHEREPGLKLKPWPHNALRHSFGSYHLAQFEDAAALALQMGNSPRMVFAHYRELVEPKDAAAFWALRPSASCSSRTS